MGMTNYRLDSFHDRDCRERVGRLSLSACDDLQAVGQMRRAAWRFECAGESRVLVLSRPEGPGWVEVARMGMRRYAGDV